MEHQLQSPKTVVIQPAQTCELSSIVIERVLDEPLQKKVIVWIKNFPHPVELASLSGENYDNPQWTNETVVQAVVEFVNSLS